METKEKQWPTNTSWGTQQGFNVYSVTEFWLLVAHFSIFLIMSNSQGNLNQSVGLSVCSFVWSSEFQNLPIVGTVKVVSLNNKGAYNFQQID